MIRPFSRAFSSAKSVSRRIRTVSKKKPLLIESLEVRTVLSASPLGIELDTVKIESNVASQTSSETVTVEAARSLVLNSVDTSYLQEGLNGIQLVDVEVGHDGSTTQFQQTYAGLPVFNSIITVSQNPQGELLSIYNHGRPDYQTTATMGPALGQIDIHEIAELELDVDVRSESQQVWTTSGRDLVLAWQVSSFAVGADSSPTLGDYLTVVDATAGEVLNHTKPGEDYFSQFASDTGVFSRIVINNTSGVAGARAYASPFDAVVEMSSGCTGTLVAPNVVVSARHCGTSGSVRFGDTGASVLTVGVATTSYPGGGSPGSSLLNGGDVSIHTLTSNVPSSVATPMRLIEETDALVDEVASTIGYGWNGLGSAGHGFSSDGWRWGGENIIDRYGAPANTGGGSNIFSTDFDNGTSGANTISGSDPVALTDEATTAPGDSGGPLLVERDGEWVIAGVLSGGTTQTSVYGDVSWWTGVAPYRAQIEAAGGVFLGGGLGTVQLDQGTYMSGDTIQITVRDPNAVSPLSVVVSSDAGDSETITLSNSGGFTFTGSITTTDNPVVVEDGELQAQLFDGLQVTYEDIDDGDGSPNTATATASIGNVEHYVSSDLPIAIEDLETVTSELTITDTKSIVDLDVEISLTHTYDSDLDVFLVGPDGTRVELFSDVGGNGNNFSSTRLDDEASSSIGSGSAPFAGSFSPAGNLSDFDGLSTAGTWTLEIFDDFAQDQGTLTSWCLYIDGMPTTPTTDGDFDNDGDYDTTDIDALVAEVVAGTNNDGFDLDGDELVDFDDVTAWLAEAGEANLGVGVSYLPADADLNGSVGGRDFLMWNANRGASGAGWSGGDFDASGETDGLDFEIWSQYKFQSSGSTLVAKRVVSALTQPIAVQATAGTPTIRSAESAATLKATVTSPANLGNVGRDFVQHEARDLRSESAASDSDMVDELALSLCQDDCVLTSKLG